LQPPLLLDGQLAARGVPEDMTIEELARGLHIHGVPFVERTDFSQRDVEVLVSLLNDPAERPHRPNVVTLLGMIGGPAEARLLIDLVDRSRTMTPAWDDAREVSAATLALGYLANRESGRDVIAFLRDMTLPGFWSIQSEAIVRALRSSAVAGLAVSGRPEAHEILMGLRSESLEADLDSLLDQALRANAEVAADGLTSYYKVP